MKPERAGRSAPRLRSACQTHGWNNQRSLPTGVSIIFPGGCRHRNG
jgi:hypothetical protein